jgi:hypothetical protein
LPYYYNTVCFWFEASLNFKIRVVFS